MYDPTKEAMPPEQRERHFNEKVAWVVKYAYRNTTAWKGIFARAGIDPLQVVSVTDLERIPVTSKEQLLMLQRANPPFGGFVAVPLSRLKRIFVSPGPIYDPEGVGAHLRWGKAFHAAGFRKGDRVINTVSYHLVPAGVIADEALCSIGATVIPAGVGNTELQVE
ncbi:phenylacetate--CoA ligase family protein, partial [Chloroflexota bacterium]